ncbi:hypothetical protein A6U87_02150 [Rhizobium sp. AC44/96]|uniref:DUF4365 domain-containing protein n=1 Tax=Rhizobium sp. AC44/96 TaxID=1841654 RepID=UPI00080FE2E4|nr:DUF4365 domain-containing protein [Rhizobium sp. AC44/96]OCJ17758.1 hypothetical protein A6U87_02150 [Rhizobium sp. AC44/96]
MITVSHLQESLSIGYVTATAAAARINLSIKREHDYGVDGTFLAMAQRLQGIDADGNEEYRYVESGTKIDFQLKCTTNWEFRGANVAWKAKAQTYNDLVSRPAYAPLLLVLMCLPKDANDWLSATEQQLILKHCCYYAELTGPTLANENSSKLIEIPRANLLTPDAVLTLLSEMETKLAGMF